MFAQSVGAPVLLARAGHLLQRSGSTVDPRSTRREFDDRSGGLSRIVTIRTRPDSCRATGTVTAAVRYTPYERVRRLGANSLAPGTIHVGACAKVGQARACESLPGMPLLSLLEALLASSNGLIASLVFDLPSLLLRIRICGRRQYRNGENRAGK
jgi:hypothetical protein